MDIRNGQSDIWVYDWTRDTLIPVTSDITNQGISSAGPRMVNASFTGRTGQPWIHLATRFPGGGADGTGGAEVRGSGAKPC